MAALGLKFPPMGKIGGLKGLSSPGGGMGKIGSKAGSPLPMMKKFLLYRNVFGNTPDVRKKMGPMGPKMGNPMSGGMGAGMSLPGTGGGPGNIQVLAGMHRMGLL